MILLAVPNISEGRDEAKIARIAGARALLDLSSDPDHNRTVLTYGGEPDAVVDACFAMIERAVSELDIRTHSGMHPRFGVVDVLPLVPYDCDEETAHEAAAEITWRIAQGPGVPVLSYGRASAQNTALPELRRWIRVDPPDAHPTAGVICLGIRDLLIAFNVNIRGELADARRALPTLRELPGLRALAFPLPSRALVQLSMNLTEISRTGPERAFQTVLDLGFDVVDAEVVGLVPEQTLGQLAPIPLRHDPRSIEEALRG